MDLPEFVWPPGWSVAAFLLLQVVIVLLWLDLARRGRAVDPMGWRPRSLLVLLAVVVALDLLIAGSWPWGRARAVPAGIASVVLAGLLPMLYLGLSRRCTGMAIGAPLWLLVGLQAFRLPLELLLHVWVAAGSIPETMTWSGQNLDVFSGIIALVAAGILWRRPQARWAAWVAQIVGLLLLLNVLRVVALSVPLPLWERWVDPPLLLAMHPPLSLIVPLCVGSALAWHLLALRALLAPVEEQVLSLES